MYRKIEKNERKERSSTNLECRPMFHMTEATTEDSQMYIPVAVFFSTSFYTCDKLFRSIFRKRIICCYSSHRRYSIYIAINRHTYCNFYSRHLWRVIPNSTVSFGPYWNENSKKRANFNIGKGKRRNIMTTFQVSKAIEM